MDDAFRGMRKVAIWAVAGSVVISGLVIYFSLRAVSGAEDRIYVLASGKVLEAIAGSRKDNVDVEARDHVRVFHELFFSLEPDEKAIHSSMGRALYLADESAKRLYDNMREAGYVSDIISGNVSQRAEIDSVQVDTNDYPFHFRCYGTEKIVRASRVTIRNLLTEGWLRHSARSDNNPHGFLIERLRVLNNNDVRVDNR